MTDKPQAYVLCSNPRSGTTLLCNMLTQTGVAGRPDSFFGAQHLADWCAEWGIAEAVDPTDARFTEEYFAAMRREGQGGTALFGLRLMGPDLGSACAWLGRRHPGLPDDAARFAAAFGPVRFLYLRRADKLAEAVSWLRAEQSGLWHSRPDGSALEELPPAGTPGYDAAALTRRIAELQALDTAWPAWFDTNGIAPLRLNYEDLSKAPQKTLSQVLAFIGVDPGCAANIAPGTRKLADATSAAWIARYKAETGRA
ncbi:hypothetical protein BOO69_08760 [Sulfitobacter alexandrii]|uniref:Sulphotransferase Stf0 domain-containing protein n=1 Tax=Sulfitobacter alexandrii TaxID=1917485 RepID=A0A1J0WGN3_9RHOB|nr:Stf0 family sulfotransferase [Sulfitobacter alexandrii]APE43492.1 hypothetical protein BOO69_08760 [Sulfitobacter alexandrii]